MAKNVYCVSIEPSLMHMLTTAVYLQKYPQADRTMRVQKFFEQIPELKHIAVELEAETGCTDIGNLSKLMEDDIERISTALFLTLQQKTKLSEMIRKIRKAGKIVNSKKVPMPSTVHGSALIPPTDTIPVDRQLENTNKQLQKQIAKLKEDYRILGSLSSHTFMLYLESSSTCSSGKRCTHGLLRLLLAFFSSLRASRTCSNTKTMLRFEP
jgi:hypothetical protein